MARADLFNTTPENLEVWADEMSRLLSKTILFHTHPTAGGSADAGPIFRVNPTQVVAYELFSTTRHVDSDANEGDAASVTLFRGLSVDVDGEPELFTTLSGGNGTAHLDTDMRYLVDAVTAGQAGLDITYHTSGGTNTGNTMPGIFQIPISLDSFGETPEVEIEQHTHEDGTQGGELHQAGLFSSTVAFSGTVGASAIVEFELFPNAFFPNLSVSGSSLYAIHGHNSTSSDASNPRFAMTDFLALGDWTYNVDFRFIDV